MKLSYKIPLAFAVALLLMLGGALYGIHVLNRSIDAFSNDVQTNVADERLVSATLVQFKLQVQEWKDALLRGKQPDKLDKYWHAFETRERAVDSFAAQLVRQLPPGESRTLVEQFMHAHTAMGDGYRRGFDAFKAAGFEPTAGDAAVAGVDREPAALLERAAKAIADESAAVEAARAGEQGRGFAVVAAEVRMLAQRSAAAAKEIKGLIEQSTQRVDAGAALISRAGESIHEIVGAVQRVTTIVGEIASASQEQSGGIQQVNIAVTQMDEATQRNAALVEQASAATQSLAEQAHALRQAVSVFRLREAA
ncbi:methyl-accepting chemotaxis protein [Burkholderia pseudomultivorans]|uniref:Methyl-accepting transducer domain-containing protein n=1 Tax=Burkholderia pseudomultivorans TaxID=1207504 RepID=A0A132EFM0_9BURK|nr:methyl-accepting chemotaxis protein [Burkholderia pseudomultivorans]KWF29372.1 hypothetical protein WT56_17900 [Burkholderia pseudomultivorans]